MKKQICKYCTHYSAYYKQWADGYGRLNNGFCAKHQKPQTQFETCEDYISREQKEKSMQERLLISLEQALTVINEIAEILKEKNE